MTIASTTQGIVSKWPISILPSNLVPTSGPKFGPLVGFAKSVLNDLVMMKHRHVVDVVKPMKSNKKKRMIKNYLGVLHGFIDAVGDQHFEKPDVIKSKMKEFPCFQPYNVTISGDSWQVWKVRHLIATVCRVKTPMEASPVYMWDHTYKERWSRKKLGIERTGGEARR